MKTLQQELEDILENTTYEDIESDLRKNGWFCPDIETDEGIEDHSTKVEWCSRFEVSKYQTTFYVLLEGSAIAEISYERWTETYGYVLEDFDIELKD